MVNIMKRTNQKDYKVFMGMTEIAGYFTRLSDSFDELGIKNYFVDIGYNSDNYDKKYKRFDNKTTKKLRKSYALYNAAKNPIAKVISLITFGFYMMLLFVWALFHADIFIFIYGNSFFSRVPLIRYLDLKLMRLFKKMIIFTYVGSDSRPLYSSIAVDHKSIEEIVALTSSQSKSIKIIERYADYVIDNPASAHFHCKKFINCFEIGMPIDEFQTCDKGACKSKSDTVTILHAPSKPELKGTEVIRRTVERLKEKGYPINYVELTGVPNHVVRKNINECDFIIDELYSDCLLAGFSTEAAIAGKPAIIGGYAGDFLRSLYSNGNTPPSIYVNPEDVPITIEKVLIGREIISEIGQKAETYVNGNWKSKIVAEKYIRIFNGDVPANWYYDPYDSGYIFGCGVHKDKIKKAVTEIGDKYGLSALCIEDKPKLINEYKKLM